jgi:hypothetical protein
MYSSTSLLLLLLVIVVGVLLLQRPFPGGWKRSWACESYRLRLMWLLLLLRCSR